MVGRNGRPRGCIDAHTGEFLAVEDTFDIEIILRARRAGYKIKEFPVRWTCDPDSRLSVVRSVWYVPRELWHIKMALRREHSPAMGAASPACVQDERTPASQTPSER